MVRERVAAYARQGRIMLRDKPSGSSLARLIWYFPGWYHSLDGRHGPLENEQPWMSFAAIDYLRRVMRPGMRVFEFGSGGSTLFFARRSAQVISVEHDRVWKDRVSAALAARGYLHCDLRLIEPAVTVDGRIGDPSDPNAYASADERYRGYSFFEYARSIDEYPDGYFDLICIDGRARPSCFKHAAPKVAPSGYLVFDNTEREYYRPATRTAPADFNMLDLAGPVPGLVGFLQTTVFRRAPGVSG